MALIAAFAVPHPPLIIPAVGQGREHGIDATTEAYREVGRRIAELDPDTIVISSPHSTTYYDYLHVAPGAHARGSFKKFGAGGCGSTVTYDEEFVQRLCEAAEADDFPAGTNGERDRELDWGVLIPLYFIQLGHWEHRGINPLEATGTFLPELPYRVVRLSVSGLSPRAHYRMGQLVQQTAEELDRRIVYIASGDLSHKLSEDGPYGYAPEGPAFDRMVCDSFSSGDFLNLLTADADQCDRAAECGLRSFQIMAGTLDRTPVDAELLSYEGPLGVGYAVAAFTPTEPAGTAPERAFGEQLREQRKQEVLDHHDEEHPLVQLARYALETYVRTGKRVNPATDLPDALTDALPGDALSTRAGVFVSLKQDGSLRGCMGTILPTRDSLAEEVCSNAVSAGCHDPRFKAVSVDELGELVYDVDVLSTPERVTDPKELDPRRYGVIVSASGGRRGLLLPDLDGIDTIADQLGIAARKGGIDLTRDHVMLHRFTVSRHL